jgi:hypothetical protein
MIHPDELNAYVDGELSPDEADAIRQHLKVDAATAAEVAQIRHLKEMLREQAPVHRNDALWRTCVGRLNEIDRSHRAERFVDRYAWAFCATLFLGLVGTGLWQRTFSPAGAPVSQVLTASTFGGRQDPQADAKAQFYNELMNRMVAENERVYVLRQPDRIQDGKRIVSFHLSDNRGPMELMIAPGPCNRQGLEATREPGWSSLTVNGGHGIVGSHQDNVVILRGDRSVDDLLRVALTVGLR